MSDREWIDAVRKQRRASARWGYPHDLSDVRAEGRVIGYSGKPMVLIEADDGEQLWWAAELTFVEEAPNRPKRPHKGSGTADQPESGPQDGRDAGGATEGER